MHFYLLLMLVLFMVGITVGYVFMKRDKLNNMTGMVVTVGISMMSSICMGAIMGIFMVHDLFSATMLGIIVGILVGLVIGWPISPIACIQGMLTGLMGSMMGVMIGNTVDQYGELIKILLLLTDALSRTNRQKTQTLQY